MVRPAGSLPRTIAFVSLQGFYTGLAAQAPAGGTEASGSLSGSPLDAGRPLLVGRCGEVLEASAELLRAGVAPGMSRREATYAAPEARWVEYDQSLFLPAAEKFWRTCAGLTPRVEPVADHEAFLDLTGGATVPGFAATLRQTLGLPGLGVCCGFAGSRLVARLAAQRAAAEAFPPFGPTDACRAIAPGDEAAFLAPLPISALWTVPKEVREQLVRLGLTTVGSVFSVPEDTLYRLFGPEAFRLLRHARGEDASSVPLFEAALAARPSARAALRQEVKLPPRASWPEVEEHLRKATEGLAAELAAGRQSCLRLRLSLPAAGGTVHEATLTPQEPPGSAAALFALASAPVRRLLARTGPGPHRLIVEVEVDRGAAQLSLPSSFTPPRLAPPLARSAPRPAALSEVLAAVNRTFAREVLFPAARLTLSRRERLRQLLPGFGHATP